MLTRRTALLSGLAGAAAVSTQSWGSAQPPKRILVLGGTVYLGPAVVEYARARGHTVTLFNRGKTNPSLFPDLELIRGDREPQGGHLSGLAGKRRLDVVIDVWPDDPALVTATAKMLVDRTDYYFFMSSIAAYHDYRTPSMDETAPTRLEGTGYSSNKARAEKAIADITSGRAGIARAAAILGPRDEGMSFDYWLTRVSAPGKFLAPGDGADPMQYVDVRDMGRWIVECAENKRSGIYNTFCRPMTIRSFLAQCRDGVGGKGQAVWVNGVFLRNVEKVGTFDNMPFWNPTRPGFATISAAKAEAVGWTQRPLTETARDAFASYRKRFPAGVKFPWTEGDSQWGISAERERKILADWAARKA
jgi:2'-hydroxyisoflavone reductase